MLRLFLEAGFVGFLLAILLLLSLRVMRPETNRDILLLGFVLGALFHLACEASGINKLYCRSGYACRA